MADDADPDLARFTSGLVATLGLRLVTAAPGSVTFAAEPQTAHANPGGTVHGGYIATLLDSAMGYAAHSVLGRGQGCTTLELKIAFQRAGLPGAGTVTATGTIVSQGRRVIFTEGRLVDGAGRLLATGSSTLLVLAT